MNEIDNEIDQINNETRYDAKIQAGVKLFLKKNWDKALTEFLSLDTHDFSTEEKIELAYYLGLCYTKLNRYEEALSYLEQVVTAHPDGIANYDFLRVFQCRMTLAYIYVLTGRVKMAEYELKRIQDIGMESPLLFNTLAYTAWLQNKFADAIELYEKTLKTEPENPTALNSLGYILSDAGIDVLRGLRYCRKAVDYNPANAAYLDSLGWAYYKNGNTPEAKKYLGRALELAPNEETIKKHYDIISGILSMEEQ